MRLKSTYATTPPQTSASATRAAREPDAHTSAVSYVRPQIEHSSTLPRRRRRLTYECVRARGPADEQCDDERQREGGGRADRPAAHDPEQRGASRPAAARRPWRPRAPGSST